MKKRKILLALLMCSVFSVQSVIADNTAISGGSNQFQDQNSNGGIGGVARTGTSDSQDHTVESQTFSNNGAYYDGGALGIYGTGNTTIKDSTFSGNTAQMNKDGQAVTDNIPIGGGALSLGSSSKTTVENSTFTGNKSGNDGGAIGTRHQKDGNNSNAQLSVKNSTFENNHADRNGGAVYNSFSNGTGDGESAKGVNFEGNTFKTNTAERGGAIYGEAKTKTTVNGDTFSGNSVTGSKDDDGNPVYGQGGAIFTERDGAELTVEDATFDGNSAQNEGGAIWSGNKTTVTNSKFTNNSTTGTEFGTGKDGQPNYKAEAEGGGAIFVGSNSKATITGSEFTGNKSGTVGGAIATRSNAQDNTSSLTVDSSSFSGNSAAKNGGAIAAYVDSTVTDTSFTGNSSGEKGGAIWSNGDLTVTAKNSDVVFSGNSSADGGDIYMDNLFNDTDPGAKLTLNAAEGKSITLEDGVSGKLGTKDQKQYEIEINKNGTEGATNTGTVTFKGEVKNAKVTVNQGTLHLAEGNSLNNSNITMKTGTTLDTTDGAFTSYTEEQIKTENGELKLKADISSATGKTDSFAGLDSSTKVTLADYNPVGDTLVSSGSISIDDLKKSLGLDKVTNFELGEAAKEEHKFLSPLRWLNSTVDDTAKVISYAPAGNTYHDFNPAVMAAPVAAQIGGYLTQLNSYDEAFRNMDMYMLLTKKQRQAIKNANKYAAADANLVYNPINTPYSDKALWARPYGIFENVELKRGPKVSNVAWGSFFGGDSELMELGNGWDGMFSVYAGYNGSHQAYDGISIYQNGATLGVVGMAYKDNFFTGLTANVGSNIASADSKYGTDDFNLLMSGVAAKTGYNWELADGRFIIQPSYLMSYSFVNTFDYNNAAGIRVKSDPLHAIQLEPGLKFIGNLNNGWQPYAGISVVWNLMDKTQFQASDATLPELSVKPFVKYGIGVRKTWGERLTGFFQTFFTGGGRNGVGFQAGVRWTLGNNSEPKHAFSSDEKKYIAKK